MVLVCPKWFWSDQIELVLTIMIWSQPKWNGHDKIELVRSKLWFSSKMNHIWTWPIHFGRDHFILVETKSLWSSPNQFGQTKTILDRPKLFWSHRRTRHKCSLIKISTHCQRVLSVSFPLMQSSSYVWSRESAELRAESRSGSNAGQSSKARSNKKFLQLYFSEAKSKFSRHFKL